MTDETSPGLPGSGFLFTRIAEHRAKTLGAGAVAGMVFGVLFGVCIVLVRSTVGDPGDAGRWLGRGTSQVSWALGLLPFAGIFFLWFIGACRQRLGLWEDRFIASLILGSGLVFLAMVFAAGAFSGALLVVYQRDPLGVPGSDTYWLVESAVARIFGVYALRMAAVFLICQATAWLRHGLMPKWLALATYLVALVLLVVVAQTAWAALVFPVWVFVISAYLLAASRREPESVPEGVPERAAGAPGR